jgi:hypothetical protein
MANSFDSSNFTLKPSTIIILVVIAIIVGIVIAIVSPIFKLLVGALIVIGCYRLWQIFNK